MRRTLGDGFEEFVSQKVCVLEGDLAEEDLGLKTEELFELSREVDVLIHCAAEASFDAPLDVALDSNVLGSLRLLRLAKGWEKKPLFLYVSNVYGMH